LGDCEEIGNEGKRASDIKEGNAKLFTKPYLSIKRGVEVTKERVKTGAWRRKRLGLVIGGKKKRYSHVVAEQE